MRTSKPIVALGALGAALALAACGSDGNGDSTQADTATSADPGTTPEVTSTLPQGSEPVELNPADFTTEITNPYWPMKPGSVWTYRESDGKTEQEVVVTVTDKTRQIANGVTARVVHDEVSEDGEPVEITDDWYAQDAEGNIWYLGEDTAEYENAKVVSKEGSFEAGVDGAEAGIIVPADPQPGLEYRQEYYEGEAEDSAKVLDVGVSAESPFGSFDDCLQTEDLNPLSEPPQLEHKFLCKDVGPVRVEGVSGGAGVEELVSFKMG